MMCRIISFVVFYCESPAKVPGEMVSGTLLTLKTHTHVEDTANTLGIVKMLCCDSVHRTLLKNVTYKKEILCV